MTFEFFNTSRLAFGSKLTAAFKQLNNNMFYALQNMETVLNGLNFYEQYKNRNYRAPVPTRPEAVVRVNELYALIDEIVTLQELRVVDNTFKVKTTFFTKNINRITNAIGETTLKAGYAYVTPAPSNSRMTREIRFSETNNQRGGEILLFQFRIGTGNRIYLIGNLTTPLRLYPQDATQYKSISRGNWIGLPYTAQDYECICVRGWRNNFHIMVNGETIVKGVGGGAYDNINHAILYLKKGDVVSGAAEFAFKINYND